MASLTAMTTLQEIEAAIDTLDDAEFRELQKWIIDRDNTKWDAQMDVDASSGKLDALAASALAALDAGKCTDL